MKTKCLLPLLLSSKLLIICATAFSITEIEHLEPVFNSNIFCFQRKSCQGIDSMPQTMSTEYCTWPGGGKLLTKYIRLCITCALDSSSYPPTTTHQQRHQSKRNIFQPGDIQLHSNGGRCAGKLLTKHIISTFGPGAWWLQILVRQAFPPTTTHRQRNQMAT